MDLPPKSSSHKNFIKYTIDDNHLNIYTFLGLVNKIWPGKYNENKTELALSRTLNISAWHENALVGCVRLLTDGYYFTTVTEILVDPTFQRQGIGAKLMELAWKQAPSSLSFGVQPGSEPFFEKLGFERGLPTYQKRKDRNNP